MKYERPLVIEIGSRGKRAGAGFCMTGSGASLGSPSLSCRDGGSVEAVSCQSGAGDSHGLVECDLGNLAESFYPACIAGNGAT